MQILIDENSSCSPSQNCEEPLKCIHEKCTRQEIKEENFYLLLILSVILILLIILIIIIVVIFLIPKLVYFKTGYVNKI